MHWIIDASDVFSTFTGRILSLITWFGLVWVSHSGACLSLAPLLLLSCEILSLSVHCWCIVLKCC